MYKHIVELIVSISFMLSTSLTLATESIVFESGIKQNTLVELYTSEGCSSCPPAEKYLNSLKNNKRLWKTLFPIAFHVDYWDYIGWKDQYAQKEFGQRQSRYASLKRTSTVYTPAFMVNGDSWRRGVFLNNLPDENSLAGNLIVTMNGSSVMAKYTPEKKYTFPLQINVAVLGMDLTSHIERGENADRIARHDFVVVRFDSAISNDMEWSFKLPKLHYSNSKKYALTIWVSEVDNPTPLQVVGGALPSFKD